MPDPRYPVAPIVVTLRTAGTEPAQALDLLRRVRLFADEMAVAGLDVELAGDLTVTVRPRRPQAPPKAAADA